MIPGGGVQYAVYAQAGRCLEDCACSGAYDAESCPMEPGCDKCFLRLHVVGAAPPGSIVVVRVMPGETLRGTVERELRAHRGLGPDVMPGHDERTTHVGYVEGCPDCLAYNRSRRMN